MNADLLALLAQDPRMRSFGAIHALRNQLPSRFDQRLLAPMEHEVWARDFVQESPMRALAMLAMVPAYQAAKATGLSPSRSGSSDPLEQIMAGYRGTLTGLRQGLGF